MNFLKLILVFCVFSLFYSCNDDDEANCESCQNLINKRWYFNLDNRDDPGNCTFVEDFILNEDGTVSVWRMGKKNDGTLVNEKIETVCNWSIEDDPACRLTINNLNELNYKADEFFDNCLASVSFSLVGELRNTPTYSVLLTLLDCDRFDSGVFIFTDFEP